MSGPTRAQYLAAARFLEGREWYVGGKACRGKAACFMTAIWHFKYSSGMDWHAGIRFNDAPGRTKAEVLSALLGLAEVAP